MQNDFLKLYLQKLKFVVHNISVKFLDKINSPSDLKKLYVNDLRFLCEEIRLYFIDTILESGGHFAGNLGVVELTVALHYVFDFEKDRIVWDVGHQSYIHKLLTGRKQHLKNIREFNGISGFPKIDESVFDHFGTGHSSTSISATLGMAVAASLKNELERKMIAVVGDGALTGGMSFEALNNINSSNTNILLVINDNHIGIDPNIGAIDKHLQEISSQIPNIFENFGLPYQGPVDGHNVEELVELFIAIKKQIGPQVVHVKTIKGKGFTAAENEQTLWHSTSRYVKIKPHDIAVQHKWQDVFAESLIELAQEFPELLGITPAMPSGSGMILAMQKFPHRFFDVGIAEQHAITFAAGLATEGFVPFVNIYSTFLQRGYDQLIHDVALQNLPVVICIDRAGLVGEDGPTHHGSFDISFLRCIPNLILSAPKDEQEFKDLMYTAIHTKKPFCIRYPKGKGLLNSVHPSFEKKNIGKAEVMQHGSKVAIIATGIATSFAEKAISFNSNLPALFHFPFVKPLDFALLAAVAQEFETILTIEDGSIAGGFGEGVADYLIQIGFKGNIKHLGIPDKFITHGDNEKLYELCGYSIHQIGDEINQLFES